MGQGLTRTFASDLERRGYEELWLGLVDQALNSLPELRTAAQSTSQARSEWLRGGSARCKRSWSACRASAMRGLGHVSRGLYQGD